MALINVNGKQEFKNQVLDNKKTVLVDFWADWCPPCKAMEPSLKNLAESLDSKLDVVKVDIEASSENSELAIENAVQSIPNMLIYKDGKVVERLIGMRPQNVLEDELHPHLK